MAFLHGDIDEEIYMKQPEGFVVPSKEQLVCKLKRSLYGLKQAPRQWYKKFDTFMLSQGFKRSHADIVCTQKRTLMGAPSFLFFMWMTCYLLGKVKLALMLSKFSSNQHFL